MSTENNNLKLNIFPKLKTIEEYKKEWSEYDCLRTSIDIEFNREKISIIKFKAQVLNRNGEDYYNFMINHNDSNLSIRKHFSLKEISLEDFIAKYIKTIENFYSDEINNMFNINIESKKISFKENSELNKLNVLFNKVDEIFN